MITYPIAVLEDRYSGTYSKGHWLAIAEADAVVEAKEFPDGSCIITLRLPWCMEHGPGGHGLEAVEFWSDPPDWIAIKGLSRCLR